MDIKFTDKTPIVFPPAADPGDIVAQYHRLKKEIEDVPDEKIVPVTVDIAMMLTIILASEKSWKQYLDEVKKLPKADKHAVDNCLSFAQVASYIDVRCTFLSSLNPIASLVADLTVHKDNFVKDLIGPANRGIIRGSVLARLRNGNGQMDLGYDIRDLVIFTREYWDVLEHLVSITPAQLSDAWTKQDMLLRLVGARDFIVAKPDELVVLRAKSFTKAVNSYDELRRGITYLRWHDGDLEQIAPSIYSGRAAPKKDPVAEVSTGAHSPPEAAQATPTVPAAKPSGSSLIVTGSTPATTLTAAEQSLPGMPPASPFGK